MNKSFETFDQFCIACVFAFILTDFARLTIEWPRLRDFDICEFYDDVHWLYSIEVIGEVRANSEGWNTFSLWHTPVSQCLVHV